MIFLLRVVIYFDWPPTSLIAVYGKGDKLVAVYSRTRSTKQSE